jgi:hypothetical protein
MAVCSVEKDLTLAKPPRLLLVPLEPLKQQQQQMRHFHGAFEW